MSKKKTIAPLGHRLRARAEPGPLPTFYVCPVCGGNHPRDQHDDATGEEQAKNLSLAEAEDDSSDERP